MHYLVRKVLVANNALIVAFGLVTRVFEVLRFAEAVSARFARTGRRAAFRALDKIFLEHEADLAVVVVDHLLELGLSVVVLLPNSQGHLHFYI